MVSYLAVISGMPIILASCMAMLFYLLGPSFLSGIGVFVISFFVNVVIAKVEASYQSLYMKKQDTRVNLTTESLNNIKNLKIYQKKWALV